MVGAAAAFWPSTAAASTRSRLQTVCLAVTLFGVAIYIANFSSSSLLAAEETLASTAVPRFVEGGNHSSSSSTSANNANHSSSGSIRGTPHPTTLTQSLHKASIIPTPPQPPSPPIVSLSWDFPARRGAYRPDHPFHVGQRSLGALSDLASRPGWPIFFTDKIFRVGNNDEKSSDSTGSSSSSSGSQLVIRLPSVDWGADLRPFTRLLTTLAVLLAMDEAHQSFARSLPSSSPPSWPSSPALVFDQIHFISPVAMFRGEGNSAISSNDNPLTTSASFVNARANVPPPSFSSFSSFSSSSSSSSEASALGLWVKDREGNRYLQWTVDFRKQGPHELFTLPLKPATEGAGGAAVAAAAASSVMEEEKQQEEERRSNLKRGSSSSSLSYIFSSFFWSASLSLLSLPSFTPSLTTITTTTTTTITPSSSTSTSTSSNAIHYQHSHHPHVYNLGSFGGEVPPLLSPLWDLDRHDRSGRMRQLAMELCGVKVKDEEEVEVEEMSSTKSSSSTSSKPIKVVIYNRDGSSRRLRHAHNTTALLHSLLLPFSFNTHTQVHVNLLTHREDLPICEVVAALADADALITPHGFSSMLLGFLPKDSLLVELMPYHFGDPTYGRLASAFNLQYMHVVSEPVRKLQPALLDMVAPFFLPDHDVKKCKDTPFCRFLASKFPVRLEADQVQQIATRIKQTIERRRIISLMKAKSMQRQKEGRSSSSSSGGI